MTEPTTSAPATHNATASGGASSVTAVATMTMRRIQGDGELPWVSLLRDARLGPTAVHAVRSTARPTPATSALAPSGDASLAHLWPSSESFEGESLCENCCRACSIRSADVDMQEAIVFSDDALRALNRA